MIDLRCCDARELIPLIEGASLIFTDPPWEYRQNSGDRQRGHAQTHYGCLDEREIASVLAAFANRAAPDAYLALWCTFPKLVEWVHASLVIMESAGWHYVSGGTWGKDKVGVGHHFLGEAELLLLYKKGKAKPNEIGGNLWLCPRTSVHSEKPQAVLRRVVRLLVPEGRLVVDPFAGESASLALACRALGRRYLGAEIDPVRYERAMLRLSQQEMELTA